MGATAIAAAFVLQGTSTAIGAINSAQATRAQTKYQQQIFEANQRLADISASDSLIRGERAASDIKRAGKRAIGTQRVSLAAQGIDISSGSALDIQEQTADFTAQDIMTVRNNAWREALGFRMQANQFGGQARFTGLAGQNLARSTLLTGGLSAASSFLQAGFPGGPSAQQYGYFQAGGAGRGF